MYTPESGSNLQESTVTVNLTVKKSASSAPTEKEGYAIDYKEEKVTANEGYELSGSKDESAAVSKELIVTLGTDIYIRKAETSTHLASNWATVDIPERPALTLEGTNISAKGFTVTVNGTMEHLPD